ncbi:hypothetical protein [Nocardioides ferulae]|uniref:hypothetical protein n=1 Tax=Nocardioides ferulae TaxID=2340821 RepID=UPI0013DDDA31|nr:hypothetical protein [Nocardioides ferulae]
MKKAVAALLAAFGLFWLVTDPQGLAQSAQKAGGNGVDLTGDVFDALIAFVGEFD